MGSTKKKYDYLVEEYKSLRNEWCERFRVIYQTLAFGFAAFFSVIGLFAKETILSNDKIFLILLSITVAMSLIIYQNFRKMYDIGAYIKVFLEKPLGLSWIEANRNRNNWGGDTKIIGSFLITLTLMDLFFVLDYSKIESLSPVQLIGDLIAVLFLLILFSSVMYSLFRPKIMRDKQEEHFKIQLQKRVDATTPESRVEISS